METLLERYRALRAPEGAAGGAGDGGGEGNGSGAGDTGGGGWTPPEGLPADYAGANADESLAKLLPAFTEANKRVEGLRSKVAQAPSSIDGYQFEPDDKLKPYFGDLSTDPAWEFARQSALDAGLSPDQLSKFVSGVYGPMADKGLLMEPLNPKAEVETFMSASGLDRDGTQKALVDAENFAKGLGSQLKDVPENLKGDVDAMLMSMTDTAAGNILLRSLAGRLNENGIRVAGEGNEQGALSADELKRLDADPRIDPKNRGHSDPNKRFDEELRRRYDEAYKKLG